MEKLLEKDEYLSVKKYVKKHDFNNDENLNRELPTYLLYHLSNLRQNVLNVISFSSDDNVLELSFECESITPKIAKQVNKVVKLDPSSILCDVSGIILDKESITNVKLINSTLDNYKSKLKFSKIILVNVIDNLSYFINDDPTINNLLNILRSLIKSNGEIYFATNNKFSIKYLSGEKNENKKEYFSSLTDSNSLSLEGLKILFEENDFDCYFYYPLPDFYFASEIYSDKYLPKEGSIKNIAKSYYDDKFVLFNANIALNQAIRENNFQTFAPSFLIKVRCK